MSFYIIYTDKDIHKLRHTMTQRHLLTIIHTQWTYATAERHSKTLNIKKELSTSMTNTKPHIQNMTHRHILNYFQG